MDKLTYHRGRLNSSHVSDNKKIYSNGWLDGYHDSHYKSNLIAVKSEIRTRRKNKVPFSSYDIDLIGFHNGMKERDKQINRMRKH